MEYMGLTTIVIATDAVPEEGVSMKTRMRQTTKERAQIQLLCSGKLYDIVSIVVVSKKWQCDVNDTCRPI